VDFLSNVENWHSSIDICGSWLSLDCRSPRFWKDWEEERSLPLSAMLDKNEEFAHEAQELDSPDYQYF
jgi:hypothetical protein